MDYNYFLERSVAFSLCNVLVCVNKLDTGDSFSEVHVVKSLIRGILV